uniref:MATH domain-containing protein n=1 Tax=Ananas comosus var. bracteatus TaxID=296719 RepID=A0A6V7PB17_ANACO|nr:unnamed protein product [Ananas comosus var. bracteatus]
MELDKFRKNPKYVEISTKVQDLVVVRYMRKRTDPLPLSQSLPHRPLTAPSIRHDEALSRRRHRRFFFFVVVVVVVGGGGGGGAGPCAEAGAPRRSTAGPSAGEEAGAPPPGQDTVAVERRGEHAALCRWTVAGFPRLKARPLWSRYFEVGGYDCRLLIYPKGDSQALPGYFSLYLQIVDPKSASSSSSKWDCFASYRLSVSNPLDDSKSIVRDSWHRFSSKKRSHGWCDFTPCSAIVDPKAGFLLPPTTRSSSPPTSSSSTSPSPSRATTSSSSCPSPMCSAASSPGKSTTSASSAT